MTSFTLSLPDYTIDRVPDYVTIGRRLDRYIETQFPGRRIALRGISLTDHPGKTLDELAAIILKIGTDRYDPQRRGIHHDYYAPFKIDLHAVPCVVADRLRGLDEGDYAAAPSVMAEFIEDAYASALAERGYALRIDLLLIYDLDQLEPVFIDGAHSLAFRFRRPEQKQAALLGLISIL